MSFHQMFLKDIYELYQEKKSDYEWIDVRRPDEWEIGTIPGVQRIVLDDLPDHFDKMDKSRTYIMICRSGGRSGRACHHMAENGFKNLINFEGGMLSWYAAGHELEK
ncbi:hypothetical protein COW36_15755 [bacterium (Candidatus Blackallbacteria) CG17_big_fil_post_rev_8_21_14_2_50_48_46]|uniref:Rhodanese domain-containing protein n=1 Tax=bacterium (Candidatus Blackallbacteria) CG17_big_fil_post_rev_8_21_14_2_50_48_46 TaxID=2014261 RepID=A0A2M7G278_9BACT|nr:MAG: hypothetical protein COW64_24355 [bacterium (Candidatus Blackallbacteria) CG18_big_fil_WC_8_21_14_2_50_49_26]PIW15801.1 MAG: hypothetical protein COW36_15755 [bacterium (Candidatus Blackallbacteria) CG17_big_fil_post_rev_8_21_14_2_50_48_46]PIW47786.1 MAG: hypothetical protein COW20_11450 [bacterium (Candidatus Blackallbacteria) CG13_big_fil_rev_8_21_14_2_50_49_14]